MGEAGERRFDLSGSRGLLMAQMLQREGLSAGSVQPIPRHDETLPAPLSESQRRLWVFEQLFPGTATYSLPAVVRLSGPLDRAALEACLGQAIGRHAVLRSTFERRDGMPVQIASPEIAPSVDFRDVADVPAASRESRAMALVQEEIETPFDLEVGPPVRVRLVRLAGDDHLLVLNTHHIVADAWSWDLLLADVADQYAAAAQGQAADHAPLPIQYGDYARWQARRFEGSEFDEALTYWRERLDGTATLLELPGDRPRPAAPGFTGGIVRFEVPLALASSLRRLSDAEGVTLFVTMLAVFQVLLYRHTGQTDFIVGTPAANRGHPQTEALVGFFVNTLPVCSEVRAHRSVRELLRAVEATAMDALAHQDVPFEQLADEVQVEGAGVGSAFPQVMFAFRDAPRRMDLGDVRCSHVAVHNGTAKRDLTLQVVDHGEALGAHIEFDAELFDPERIERMAAHYERLLREAAADPGRPISELPMLTPAEERLIAGCNDTERPFARAAGCVHEAVARQAAEAPERTAVVCEGAGLTHRELDERARQLASLLAVEGTARGARVAVRMSRSVEMAVAVLGILKAGAAFVPLDPSLPPAPARDILERAGARTLVTDTRSGQQPPGADTVVELDPTWAALEGQPADAAQVPCGPADAAYVLYTSGSTGRPKGVVVEHRQIMNYVEAVIERVGLEPHAAYAMLQPLSVDSCLTMLLPPLVTGGELHMVTRERALDAEGLADCIQADEIDYLKIAPSHLRALEGADRFIDILPRLGLIVGGEASDWRWLRKVQSRVPDCAVHNHYGPTEATVGVLTFPMSGAAEEGTAPLGYPIANTRVHVLDEQSQPVPVGVPGQLHIGGAAVARCYLGEPGLTARRFVPDPFGHTPGDRLYATGDIGRLREDGAIEFLGRRDDQVKIRGFRVELGEIQGALVDHPRVREAVVTTRQEADSERRILAYAVPEDGSDLAPSDLEAHLRDRLPPHMVPAEAVVLAALPLTPHGKVDHQRLRAASLQPQTQERDEPRAPQNERERTIAGIWQRLLASERVGAEDNFFDLGGHSLLVMRLHEELQTAFGTRFELIELFNHTTVKAQAQFIGADHSGHSIDRAQERGRKQSELMRRRRRARAAGRGQSG